MLNLVRPEFLVPVHGEYRMLDAHKQLAVQAGIEAGNVFVVDDGDVWTEISRATVTWPGLTRSRTNRPEASVLASPLHQGLDREVSPSCS